MGHLLGQPHRNVGRANIATPTNVEKPILFPLSCRGGALQPGGVHEGGHIVLRRQVTNQTSKLTPRIVAVSIPILNRPNPIGVSASKRGHALDVGVALRLAQLF